MSIKLTAQDLSRLENLRLDRVRQLYSQSLGCCLLRLNRDTLIVHCPEPWLVDQLIDDLDRIVKSIWMTLGVKYVSIRYAREEVYRAKTRGLRSCVKG